MVNSPHRFVLSLFLKAMLLAGGCGSVDPPGSVPAESPDNRGVVATLSVKNEDVKWNRGYLGHIPIITGDTRLAVDRGRDSIPELRQSLLSEDSYVAAHIALSIITERYEIEPYQHYNGLEVAIESDGSIQYGGLSQADAVAYWESVLREAGR